MSTDNAGAYQEMCQRIREACTSADMQALLGYAPELRYADVNYPKEAVQGKVWCRFTMAKAEEKTRTLGRTCRITYTGIAGIQLFVPITDPQAAERVRRAGDKLKSAFAFSTANVNFYKAGLNDLPPDPPWLYKRITATYEYVQFQKG